MSLTRANAERLLDDLSLHSGFCLRPEQRERLLAEAPVDAEAFTNALFRAEGVEPDLVGRRLFRQVREGVAQAFRAQEEASPSPGVRGLRQPRSE